MRLTRLLPLTLKGVKVEPVKTIEPSGRVWVRAPVTANS